MKQLFLLFITILTLTTFACNSSSKIKVNQKKPESVAISFVQYIAKLDLEKAQSISMGQTKQMLGLAHEMMGSTMSAEDKAQAVAEAEEELQYVKKAECDVNDDKAACTICCSKEGESSPQAIELTKVDGQWFVDMPMPNKEGGGGGF